MNIMMFIASGNPATFALTLVIDLASLSSFSASRSQYLESLGIAGRLGLSYNDDLCIKP
jgi:hypothetical protein